jgi:DNA primase
VTPSRDQRQAQPRRAFTLFKRLPTDAEKYLQSTSTTVGAREQGRRGSINPELARAVIVGLTNFPQALEHHTEQLAALPIADQSLSRLRDRLVDAAWSGETLDREGLATILASGGTAADVERARRTGTMAFSFTRSDTAPERAVRDLGTAIDALMADGEIGAALQAATERLKEGEEDALEEQRRLHLARMENNERLASLAGSE